MRWIMYILMLLMFSSAIYANGCIDTDSDLICDIDDPDDDNDGLEDALDIDPLDPYICIDSDSDSCDDCSIGTDGFGPMPDNNPIDDGIDSDSDGMCDNGDICPLDNPDDSDGDSVCDSSDICPGFNDLLDSDGDTLPNGCDNCVSIQNIDQSNTDGDTFGDACDVCPDDPLNDADGDMLCANVDNCPSDANPSQEDSDGDNHGDACDNCPTLSNATQDDADVDTHGDECDNCPCIANSTQSDSDGNNRGDACEVGSAKLFVNEFHYDNLDTDVDEKVELVATTNLDLTGWKFQLYNGVVGSVYADIPLSGNISSYGFKVIGTPGMQNGAPDGMAVVDPDGKVVQFLSYEGSFTAYDCPAKGLTSSDVGVFESSVPYGHSLQLSGSGAIYEDFHWTDAKANTFGAVNTGQSFPELKAQPQIIMYLLD